MMKEGIRQFHTQFDYEPKIENLSALHHHKKYILAGMGGSNLVGDLLHIWRPSLDIITHKTYGLPPLSHDELRKHLVIISSHSGNTEEAVDALHTAMKLHLDTAIITTGGTLLELAEENQIPYVAHPDTGIQPRLAIAFHIKASLSLMGENEAGKEISGLSHSFRASDFKDSGKKLAKILKGKIPVIYSSDRNRGLAYNWKIKCNETGKIPAFYNVFPELNHNEMTGFDRIDSTKGLSEKISFVFLTDKNDHPRTIRRMEICKELYKKQGLPVTEIEIRGSSTWHRIFGSLVTADWTAFHLSEDYGTEPDIVPMVEEFKKLIK